MLGSIYIEETDWSKGQWEEHWDRQLWGGQEKAGDKAPRQGRDTNQLSNPTS